MAHRGRMTCTRQAISDGTSRNGCARFLLARWRSPILAEGRTDEPLTLRGRACFATLPLVATKIDTHRIGCTRSFVISGAYPRPRKPAAWRKERSRLSDYFGNHRFCRVHAWT